MNASHHRCRDDGIAYFSRPVLEAMPETSIILGPNASIYAERKDIKPVDIVQKQIAHGHTFCANLEVPPDKTLPRSARRS